MDQNWLRKIGGIDPAGLAECPALNLSRRHIQRVNIGIGARRCQIESQIAIIFIPPHPRNNSFGQFGHGFFLSCGSVKQVQYAVTVFVGDERDQPAIVGKVELVDVPGNVAGQVSMLPRSQIDVGQSMELSTFVGRGIDSLTVLAEMPACIVHFCVALGREQFLFSRVRIH